MDDALKIKGALFGFAVGDALGCTLEFMNETQMNERLRLSGKLKEIEGGGIFGFEKGEVTDDTDMLICVARGIFQNYNYPIIAIGEEFIQWYHTRPKDVGMTVRASIQNYLMTEDWEEAALMTHEFSGGKSAGNGSLMRCLPIALAYNDLSSIKTFSRKQSLLTHYDNTAAECCVLYNAIAFSILHGVSLKNSLEAVLQFTSYYDKLQNKPTSNPDSYVVHTFEWVVHLLYQTNTFEEAVIEAVNKGYDADTVGALVGGLAGLHYGYDAIPKRYIDTLLCKGELNKVTEAILALRT